MESGTVKGLALDSFTMGIKLLGARERPSRTWLGGLDGQHPFAKKTSRHFPDMCREKTISRFGSISFGHDSTATAIFEGMFVDRVDDKLAILHEKTH